MEPRKRKACALLSLLLPLMGSAGCATTGAVEAPPARPPVLASVHAVHGRSCTWTAFEADPAGKYALLPSGDPDGAIRVAFRAPYPSQIEVDIAGRFVLPNAERIADRNRGYYRVDSVARADGLALWQVTIAPPTAARLMAAFELNIRNVSVDPKHAGADRTSAPLTLSLTHGPVADVDGWLDQHPKVRNALTWHGLNYGHWAGGDKQVFRDAFELAWNGSSLPLPDLPPLRAVVGARHPPTTVLTPGHAKSIFIAQAAAGLAAEIGGWTSWSITTYTQDQLELLFDSRRMFRWNAQWNGFEMVHDTVAEGVAPESPQATIESIYENGLFSCTSRQSMVSKTLEWLRANPIARYRTAGCPATVALLHGVLRLANIPVKPEVGPLPAGPSFVAHERQGAKLAPEPQALWSRIEPKIDGLADCAALTPP